MQSLRDKLLKAGLVTADQAKAAETARPEPSRRAPEPPARALPRSPRVERPAPRDDGPIPALPPMPGSKAHQRLEAVKQQELDRQLRELARGAEVPREDGARTFHFMTRKRKLRRIDLSEAQGQRLEAGDLAIVESPEPAQIEHVLVPAATAELMLALSDKAVRFWNRDGKPIGFDDEEPAASEG